MKLLKKIFKLTLLLFLLLLLIAGIYYFSATKNAVLHPERLVLTEKRVTVYDKNGKEIPAYSALSRGQTVSFSEIPKKALQAFIDVEDKRFYTHNGFDLKRIARAFVKNLKSRSFQQGASTISQQLIKNTHLTQEKTVRRKLCEWKLTRALEKRYSKDEILEKYLNLIYFGHDCFGLHAASAFYFGKRPAELDLADAALLAGLVRSPNNYSPFKNPEKCQKRRRTVLNLMFKNGSITETEKEYAENKPLPTQPFVRKNGYGYGHFVFDELTALADKYAFPLGGDLEIFTYFDPAVQSIVEKASETHTESDKLLIVSDAETCSFTACVSTVGAIERLPGSLLKPLLVYAPAIEENIIAPATPIADEPVDFNGYAPKNYDGKFHGYTSARECLAQSLNVPAVRLLETLGVENAVRYLEKADIQTERSDHSLALALGGMQKGFPLPKLVSAYTSLINGGAYQKNAFISEIKQSGKTVYKRMPHATQVYSKETAALVNDMLQTTARTGTAKKLRSLPFAIAAKTGTAGTTKGNTDAYAISYTTKYCLGVWLGNATGGFIDYTGGGVPCNLSYKIHEGIFQILKEQGQSIPNFVLPNSVVTAELDKTYYYDTHRLYLSDPLSPKEYRIQELFKKDALPLKTSDLFSNPAILTPKIQYNNGKVSIDFENKSPRFYRYKIERYDYDKQTTVYEGEFVDRFTDKSVCENKSYRYFVTPIYKDRIGARIALPEIHVDVPDKNKWKDKPWWEY